MRIAIWSYTAAVGFASLAVAALGGMFGSIFYRWLGDKPLPAITQLLIDFHWWTFAVPLPWVLVAIWFSRRDAATQSRVFAFSGISTLAVAFLFTFAAVALTLPFASVHCCLH